MSKSCAKCTKAVYPLEEFKCLDKVWHKGCFKCHECGMTLNMKTYKGFNKLPYCEAHIPKAKATTVADTPEMKRIQENTKIQSNAAYHAEFEKSKGKFTAVTDDPELLRIKANTKIISNVSYHGDLEKKSAMESKRNLTGEGGDPNSNGIVPPSKSPSYLEELSAVPQPPAPQTQRYGPPPTPANAYNRTNNHYTQEETPRTAHVVTTQNHHAMAPPQHQQINQASPYSSRGAPNVVYSSDGSAVNANASRSVGSIADYDPVNNYFGSLDPQRSGPTGRIGSGAPAGGGARMQQQQQGYQQQQHGPPPQTSRPPNNMSQSNGVCYRALYDYEAQDMDEVSFGDGDLIVQCTAVDEGWMTGTVQRTGKRGMLPANYVAPAN